MTLSQSIDQNSSFYAHSHSNVLIPIPIHPILIPIPIPWLIVFPFPWESHGTHGIPVFPIPMHISTTGRWLVSVTVRTLDLWSRGRGFNSRSGRYQVVSTWMGDCLRTDKPSRYITNTNDRTFPAAAASVWNNSLPESVRASPSLQVFRSRLKTELFARSYSSSD